VSKYCWLRSKKLGIDHHHGVASFEQAANFVACQPAHYQVFQPHRGMKINHLNPTWPSSVGPNVMVVLCSKASYLSSSFLAQNFHDYIISCHNHAIMIGYRRIVAGRRVCYFVLRVFYGCSRRLCRESSTDVVHHLFNYKIVVVGERWSSPPLSGKTRLLCASAAYCLRAAM